MDRANHRAEYWNRTDKQSHTCPDCGRGHDAVESFEIHHLDGDPTNGAVANLVGLCRECHRERHGEWIDEVYGPGRRRRQRHLRRRLE